MGVWKALLKGVVEAHAAVMTEVTATNGGCRTDSHMSAMRESYTAAPKIDDDGRVHPEQSTAAHLTTPAAECQPQSWFIKPPLRPAAVNSRR